MIHAGIENQISPARRRNKMEALAGCQGCSVLDIHNLLFLGTIKYIMMFKNNKTKNPHQISDGGFDLIECVISLSKSHWIPT